MAGSRPAPSRRQRRTGNRGARDHGYGYGTSLLGDAPLGDPARKMVSEVSKRPSLLYVSPVVPSATGSGIAMRGGMVLEALCERYRVSLLAIPLYPTLEQQVPEFLPTLCENIAILQPRESALDQMRRAGEVYQGHQFDIVHVFRLAAMAFAQPY